MIITVGRTLVIGGLVALTPVLPATTTQAALSVYDDHCVTASPQRSNTSFPEVHGIASGGTLWALLFYRPPARAGVIEKIAIRMTGSGTLHIVAIDPRGRAVPRTWGPEAHSGSNWNRPGDEWGTGWKFSSPGCWHLHATRSSHTVGNVWLRVSARTAKDYHDIAVGHTSLKPL